MPVRDTPPCVKHPDRCFGPDNPHSKADWICSITSSGHPGSKMGREPPDGLVGLVSSVRGLGTLVGISALVDISNDSGCSWPLENVAGLRVPRTPTVNGAKYCSPTSWVFPVGAQSTSFR